ncbi:hypothetical protein D3C87_2067010 [compost metagenome]
MQVMRSGKKSDFSSPKKMPKLTDWAWAGAVAAVPSSNAARAIAMDLVKTGLHILVRSVTIGRRP